MRAIDVMTTNVITVDPKTREMGHRWSLRRARGRRSEGTMRELGSHTAQGTAAVDFLPGLDQEYKVKSVTWQTEPDGARRIT